MVGTMVAGNDALDYAVIQFDPQKVRPVNNVNGFEIDGLGPDPVTATSRASSAAPPAIPAESRGDPVSNPARSSTRYAGSPVIPGRPVTVNNRLVGMIHGAFSEELPAVHHPVHPAAHPGGDDVVQHPAGRHRREEPAGFGLRPDRCSAGRLMLFGRASPASGRCPHIGNGLLAGPDRLEHVGVHQR